MPDQLLKLQNQITSLEHRVDELFKSMSEKKKAGAGAADPDAAAPDADNPNKKQWNVQDDRVSAQSSAQIEAGAILQEVREAKNMTQSEAAEATGITQAVISDYETGLKKISHSDYKLFSKLYGVTVLNLKPFVKKS